MLPTPGPAFTKITLCLISQPLLRVTILSIKAAPGTESLSSPFLCLQIAQAWLPLYFKLTAGCWALLFATVSLLSCPKTSRFLPPINPVPGATQLFVLFCFFNIPIQSLQNLGIGFAFTQGTSWPSDSLFMCGLINYVTPPLTHCIHPCEQCRA